MTEHQRALAELERLDGTVTTEIINDLVNGHADERRRMRRLYDEYRGEVPILDRKASGGDGGVSMVNDYRGDIIDTITGYVFGKPITYTVEDASDERVHELLRRFLADNGIADLDARTGKTTSICGSASRLCYINTGGTVRVMAVPPWESVFIRDGSRDDIRYAMRYYTVETQERGVWRECRRIEWYDARQVTYLVEDDKGAFVSDPLEPLNPCPHMFDGVPLISFQNNDEEQGDFEKVVSLIDGYDRAVSYDQDEIEALRHAYLKITGATLDADDAEAARLSRSFNIPDGGDIEFLVKNINDRFNENHIKRLEENIYRFSHCPNMSDEKFSGAGQSGESRKWKLFGLENRSIAKERKFNAGLRAQFAVVTSAWRRMGYGVNAGDIAMTFSRNMPVELKYEAEVTNLLKGVVSERTRLRHLSLVNDVESELSAMNGDVGG